LCSTPKKMKVIVRDFLGCNYEIECLPDDSIDVLIEIYKSISKITVDESQYKLVARCGGGGVILEGTQLLEDVGISEESTIRIEKRKLVHEFQVIDFDVKLNFTGVVIRPRRGGWRVSEGTSSDMDKAMGRLDLCREIINEFGDDEDKLLYRVDGEIEDQYKRNPTVYANSASNLGHRAQKCYLKWLSVLADEGWEIVDVHHHRRQNYIAQFPKIHFKRRV
jgi:hypothetical protein